MKIERLKPVLQYDENWIEQRKQYYITSEGYEEEDALEQATADYEEVTKVDWTRDFQAYDDDGNIIFTDDEIICKKLKVKKLFEEDPDLLDMLGMPEYIVPIEKKDTSEMSEEERVEYEKKYNEYLTQTNDRNERISEPEIIPWLKLNGVVKTVSNRILFDFFTERQNYDNPAFSKQYLIVMCLVDETAMDTDFGIPRADLVSYIVKDLLNRTDYLGMNLVLASDEPKIVDNNFYCRELRFAINQPNYSRSQNGLGNRYDHFR